MIRGTISPQGVPVVEIPVAGEEWSAVIDTGFNGDLELPLRLKSRLRARYVGRLESILAGGQRVEEDAYMVEFPFDGEALQADATFVAGDEILIGTNLLRSHRLEIVFPRGTMLLQRE